MNRFALMLVTCALALTACGSMPPVATTPVSSVPTPATSPPAAPTAGLGMIEIEFSGTSAQSLQVRAVRSLGTQALTDNSCITLGAVASKATVDLVGRRYMQATFPVTNGCTTSLQNLTFVAVRRLGTNATLGSSAITSMKTFGNTDAAVGLATQILPTQPVYASHNVLNVDQSSADLQVFSDTAGGELDGLQAQVDPGGAAYDLLPYGFVTTTRAGGRVIPANGTGDVTFALSLPIQPVSTNDVFSFRLLVSAASNSVTSVTQGLEEQDAAGRAAAETRAAALPGAEIRTLLGQTLTPATLAKNGLPVCQVRIAGPRSAPSATLVNTQATLAVTAPGLPSIVGGAQPQPVATLTANGAVFPTLAQYVSTTPATVNVTNNLVRPVTSSPLAWQTGSVQASACNQTVNVAVRTSPFTSLDGGDAHSLALKPDGTVVAWGSNASGQATVPSGLSGVVTVSAGQNHSLALKSDGTVVAWGSNASGQATVPSGLSGVMAVSAGGLHSLALKSDGTVVAWGDNTSGQSTVPSGLSGVVAVSAGQNHSVALKSDGTVVAWGNDDLGQTDLPAGLSGVVAVSVGSYHTLALKSDGTVVAWGDNTSGQATVPADLSGVVAVSAGGLHNLALKSDGTVVAWGNDDLGQTDVPAGLSGVVSLSAGYVHSLALKSDGTVAAWGSAASGQTPVPTGLKVLVP
ncbi:hypothetical protein Q0M94_20985 (plasmid) [Deinococcus radiomollis]|uniref:RCC1 domain-containing protein n=1 Tax=Deinococcus radiomollis TaxID=468916 RepID=UPI003891A645